MNKPTMVFIGNDGTVWIMDGVWVGIEPEYENNERGVWVTLSEYESGGYSAPRLSNPIPHETRR